jgi:hypothetical protein
MFLAYERSLQLGLVGAGPIVMDRKPGHGSMRVGTGSLLSHS